MTDQVLERFWEKVKVDSVTGCWNWQAWLVKGGYGQFSLNHEKSVMAHRFAYEVNKGKIPEGLTLDHLCKNPKCVNPDHMEPVTMKENLYRGKGICTLNSQKTHCKRGHLLQGDNLYPVKNGRMCRLCNLNSWRRRHNKPLLNSIDELTNKAMVEQYTSGEKC